MRTRRQVRRRRVPEILRVLDAADALLDLSDSLTAPAVWDEDVNGTNLYDSNWIRSRLADDNNGGVTRLSAHLVTLSFPVDQRGSCSIVYQRCRRAVPPFEVSAGGDATVVAGDGGENANPWAVDPHPLSDYGEVLHTPFAVLDMLS
ncbi:hypothetical protein Hanom_Chr06g00555101 [Helianthus anomalus]